MNSPRSSNKLASSANPRTSAFTLSDDSGYDVRSSSSPLKTTTEEGWNESGETSLEALFQSLLENFGEMKVAEVEYQQHNSEEARSAVEKRHQQIKTKYTLKRQHFNAIMTENVELLSEMQNLRTALEIERSKVRNLEKKLAEANKVVQEPVQNASTIIDQKYDIIGDENYELQDTDVVCGKFIKVSESQGNVDYQSAIREAAAGSNEENIDQRITEVQEKFRFIKQYYLRIPDEDAISKIKKAIGRIRRIA
jgi:hypothetical protein